jgi:hypothetical protein
VFRNQQPEASHAVGNLIGQPLTNAAFDAERIAVDVPDQFLADSRLDAFRRKAWTAPVEFFFEGRSRPARAPRCGC